MVKQYKSALVFKASALFMALVLAIGLIFGSVTVCRYLTKKDLDVSYYAKSVPPMFMDSQPVNTNILLQTTNWQSVLNQTSADFTLKNTLSSETAPGEDIMFSVRVLIEQTGTPDDSQLGDSPIQVVLTTGGDTYRAAEYSLEEDTPFYQYSKLNGEFYAFGADDSANSAEAVFCLKGGSSSAIDFNITVHNLQTDYQKVYLYIKRI